MTISIVVIFEHPIKFQAKRQQRYTYKRFIIDKKRSRCRQVKIPIIMIWKWKGS